MRYLDECGPDYWGLTVYELALIFNQIDSLNLHFITTSLLEKFFLCFRLILAGLHFNENSDRLQAVCKDGRPQFALRFPKAKKGDHSIYVVKAKPTFSQYYHLQKLCAFVNLCKTFIPCRSNQFFLHKTKLMSFSDYAFDMIKKAISSVREGSRSFYREESLKSRASEPMPLAASIEQRPAKSEG